MDTEVEPFQFSFSTLKKQKQYFGWELQDLFIIIIKEHVN